jgi:chromosome segregation ATPase
MLITTITHHHLHPHSPPQVTLPPGRLLAIVGPNGAGKSNIMEAVAFAAGCGPAALRVAVLRDLASSEAKGQVGGWVGVVRGSDGCWWPGAPGC